jgi:hypothetical protein
MAHDTQEMIRLKAYEIWQREGFPEGREREHWELAELELGLSTSEAEDDDDSMDAEGEGVEGPSGTSSYKGEQDAEVGSGANPAKRSRTS